MVTVNDLTPDIASIEQAMLKAPQVECPITHHFGGGIYLREMFAPAGTLLLGHEHKGDHMCVLLKGSMRIFGDGIPCEITAPMIFMARAGRKFALTLEDTVFANIHPTEETDPAKCEELFVTKSDAYLEVTSELPKLQGEE